MKYSEIKASDIIDKQKRSEFKILEKCYSMINEYTDIKIDTIDGEEPDFILTHPDGYTLGMEITEAHSGLVLRKLRNDSRYFDRLMKGDAAPKELECIQKVNVQNSSTNKTAFGIAHRGATIEETRSAITEALRKKNSKFYSRTGALGLTIMDYTETFYPADFIDTHLPRKEAFFLSERLGEELIKSQFDLIYLVTPKSKVDAVTSHEIEYEVIDLHQEFIAEKFRLVYAACSAIMIEDVFEETINYLVNVLKIGISVVHENRLCLIYKNRFIYPEQNDRVLLRKLHPEEGYFETVDIYSLSRTRDLIEDVRILEYKGVMDTNVLHLRGAVDLSNMKETL